MKTAMQELRDDLVKSLETGNEALNEIIDEKLREICQKVAQLTLESIIKRIDDELLEMEAKQKGYSEEDVRDAFALGMDYYAEPNDWDKVTPKQKLENLLNKQQEQ
jgi:dsDNA-specific endonuclease/ATPase MutS2